MTSQDLTPEPATCQLQNLVEMPAPKVAHHCCNALSVAAAFAHGLVKKLPPSFNPVERNL